MKKIFTNLVMLAVIVAMSVPSTANGGVYSWADLDVASYGQASALSQSLGHFGDHPNAQYTEVLPGKLRDQSGISFTPATRGGSMDISAKVWTNSGWIEHISIWVDWDGNGTFDADECVVSGIGNCSSNYSTATFTVPVPSDAVDSTYMRAIIIPGVAAPNPDDSLPYGDVEDYRVTVRDLTAPEFGSLGVALAILLTTPAFAYLIVKRKR